MVAGEGISRADLGNGGIGAGSGTGRRRTVPPENKLWRSNSNSSCMAVYDRGLLACLCLVKPLHKADSMTTRYLLILLSSVFLLTKTLRSSCLFFFSFPFSFEDLWSNFLTLGSNYRVQEFQLNCFIPGVMEMV